MEPPVHTIVQTPQCLTITLSIGGEADRTHAVPGVDAKLGALVRRILESGHCPTPIDRRACVECEGAGCAWGKYEWYMWFPEEEAHSVNAFNDLNEYVFAITPEWKGIPAFFGYSPTPPEHVQAQGIFLQNMILRTDCALRLFSHGLAEKFSTSAMSVSAALGVLGGFPEFVRGKQARLLYLETALAGAELFLQIRPRLFTPVRSRAYIHLRDLPDSALSAGESALGKLTDPVPPAISVFSIAQKTAAALPPVWHAASGRWLCPSGNLALFPALARSKRLGSPLFASPFLGDRRRRSAPTGGNTAHPAVVMRNKIHTFRQFFIWDRYGKKAPQLENRLAMLRVSV